MYYGRKNQANHRQRSYGDYKDGWKIPGGKLEPGETPEAWKPRVKISPILPIPQFYDNILFIRAISSVVRAEDS